MASLDRSEQPVPQRTIDTVASLLPPLGQDVTTEQKTGLLQVVQKACTCALDVLANEKAQYLRNMRIFQQLMQRRINELRDIQQQDRHREDVRGNPLVAVGSLIGDGVLQTSNRLDLLVDGMPEERAHERYLADIQRYWRRFSGREGARGFEDGWVYLADCELTWEY